MAKPSCRNASATVVVAFRPTETETPSPPIPTHRSSNNGNRGGNTSGTATGKRSYSLAIARKVPKAFPNALTMDETGGPLIDCRKATIEHDNYLDALRRHVPVLCLPALDDLPDSVFVEDTVVAIGNRAVITNPGHPSRRPEVDSIRKVLEDQLGMEVTDMRESNERAFCDGGDVLYTGRHLFVGISGERTNREALEVLQEGLGIEAIPIPFRQRNGALHLKSITTHIDDRTLVVPDHDLGHTVLQTIEAEAGSGSYSRSDVVWLPEHAGLSCNVVSVGSRGVLAQVESDGDSATRGILQEAVVNERNLRLDFVSQSEAAKCDGALTCCSVLLDI